MNEPTQQTNLNWLEEEQRNSQSKANFGERLPTLKLEKDKVTTFEVDFSEPFNKWVDTEAAKPVTKAIIPVTHKGERKNLWLNVKNPLYHQIIDLGKRGQRTFKVSTSGSQADTRYTIVTDD